MGHCQKSNYTIREQRMTQRERESKRKKERKKGESVLVQQSTSLINKI